MPARFGVRSGAIDVFLPFRLLLGDPGLPGLSGGRIFSREGKRHHLRIRDGHRSAAGGREQLNCGLISCGSSIKEVAGDLAAGLQFDGDISPVIKGEFDGLAQFSGGCRSKNPAFKAAGLRRVALRVSHSLPVLRKGDGEAFGRPAAERLTMATTIPIETGLLRVRHEGNFDGLRETGQ